MVTFSNIVQFAWIIPVLPLLGFMLVTFFSKSLKGITSGIIASLTTFIAFLFTLLLFILQSGSSVKSMEISLFTWMHVGTLNIPFSLLVDPLAINMMLVVTGVGFLIHVFSIGYMHHDERFNTFFAYMNLFTAAMLLLVTGANYLIMFIGWEGVGLCSYLLIGFWYKNDAYNLAARKAFIMNRIGDLGFVLGMLLIFFTFGTLNFTGIAPLLSGFMPDNWVIILVTLLLFIGAVGKSAQIPLFTWLPDAMAGPTPVSALIHAATMVTAGIYLIARSSFLFSLAPFTLSVILGIGLATALLAASIGLFQNDIKKVLAYSTVSQLGFMFIALGLGAYSTAVFHLTTHAFFKALLFLGAGSVIHALNGEQDIRNMGGLRKKIPLTFYTFLIGTLAISGFPPFSGFFSKDEILSLAFSYNPVIYSLCLLAALMTCFYMFRLLFLVFYNDNRGPSANLGVIRESPRIMTVSLLILAFLSFFGGLINIPEYLGGHASQAEFLAPGIIPPTNIHLSASTEYLLVLVSLFLLSIVLFFCWKFYVSRKNIPLPEESPRPFMQQIIYRKYYIDEFYNWLIVNPYTRISRNLSSVFEDGIIDKTVNNIGKYAFNLGDILRKMQVGNISTYIFGMVAGIILFIIITLYF